MYIVPSKPLALQVAAIFNNIVDTRLSIYVEDFSYTSLDPLIVVGTPYEIETKLSINHNIKGTNMAELTFKKIHFLVALIIKLYFVLKLKLLK